MTDETARNDSAASKLNSFLDATKTDIELVRECMWRIIDLIKEMTRMQRRLAVLTATFAFVFELLNRGLIGEASFSGLHLSSLDFLRTLIPVVISYLVLRFTALSRDVTAYPVVLYHITENRFPSLYNSDLDRLLVHLTGNTVGTLPSSYAPYGKALTDRAAILESAASVLSAPVFLIYAFWQLFSSNGLQDVFVWASLFVTLLLLFFAGAFGVMAFKSAKDLKDWPSKDTTFTRTEGGQPN